MALTVLALGPVDALAQRAQPEGPAAPRERYQPDQQTCTPERQMAAFTNALVPYADQPPAVLEQLRGLQRQLSARSLRSCLERGLLTADQVERLMETMGLTVPERPPLPKESPVLSAPRPAPLVPAASRPAAPERSIVQPATVQPATVQPATVKPTKVQPSKIRPATLPPRSRPSSNPKPSAFDMSPIEGNPARTAPIDPGAQDNPSSPR